MFAPLLLLVTLATPAAAPPAPPIPLPAVDQWARAINNPRFPLSPGAMYAYADSAGAETDTMTVLRETEEIVGVHATVVSDRAFHHGRLVEETRDYYAQDKAGNVWYLGEDTHELKDGKVTSSEGSWRWGRDGGLPGIVMWASPKPGDPYRQEYLKGHAEDMARVVESGVTVSVPGGRFSNCLATEEWSPLEPKARERKLYAPGVGLVEERSISGGHEHMVLVGWMKPAYEN
jgi:hypothetical protein